jgi:uncharacterized protein YegP (UPF0339 family)
MSVTLTTSVTATKVDAAMAAKFEIRQPVAGQFRWVLTSQGRTLATSPAYSRRRLAEKSIDSFRMAAIAAPVADQTPTRSKGAPGKVARGAGRAVGKAVGKAVVKGRRAVETAEKTVAKAPKTVAAKPAAPRKRGSRSR